MKLVMLHCCFAHHFGLWNLLIVNYANNCLSVPLGTQLSCGLPSSRSILATLGFCYPAVCLNNTGIVKYGIIYPPSGVMSRCQSTVAVVPEANAHPFTLDWPVPIVGSPCQQGEGLLRSAHAPLHASRNNVSLVHFTRHSGF